MSTAKAAIQSDRFIRLPELKRLLGFSATSTIYSMMSDGDLPAPVRIGRRAVAWRASCIDEWMSARPSTRIAAAAEAQQQPSPAQAGGRP